MNLNVRRRLCFAIKTLPIKLNCQYDQFKMHIHFTYGFSYPHTDIEK